MLLTGCGQHVVMAEVLTVTGLLDGHVGLDVECLDRLYLNGYVPKLQVSGQVAGFMTRHLGYPIPSPAIMEKIGTGSGVRSTPSRRLIRSRSCSSSKDDRKQEVMRPYLERQAATGLPGVAAIGVAQEYQNVFACL